MNYTGIPTSLAFLVSKMGLTTPLAQMVSWKKIFEVVVEEVVMKCKNCMFFSFWYFEVATFSLTCCLSNQFSFAVVVRIYKIRVFDEAFFKLTTSNSCYDG